MTEFIKNIEFEVVRDSNETYHSKKDYIGASGLKRLKKSPLHFIEEERIDSDALRFGSAYHTFLLEPEKFYDEYFVFDDSAICSRLISDGAKSPRSTNKYKEWHLQETEKINGKSIIDTETFSLISRMATRLRSDKLAKSLISKGEAEISIYAEITIITGQKVKVQIRPDYLKAKNGIVTDTKTTADASVNGFSRLAAEYDYHIQAALYSDILKALYGCPFIFFFMAQEKTAPFAFNIFEASEGFISQGRYEYEQLLMLYAFCLENNVWPGYQVHSQSEYGVCELNLPAYAVKEINWYNHYKQLTNA